MIESLTFQAGELCKAGTVTFSPPPGDFASCVARLGLTDTIVTLLSSDFQISPVAQNYATLFRDFLWKGCAPTMITIVGLVAIPRILNAVFKGV